MQRHRPQRALVLLWLTALLFCALTESSDAQLLYDESDNAVVQSVQWVERSQTLRTGESPIESRGGLDVLSENPEELVDVVYVDDYDSCDACADPTCDDCRRLHASPMRWFNDRVERMQIQQQDTSWLNRPASFGVFAGNIWADDPIKGRVSRSDGFVGGYLLGEDLSINWGWEMRLALSALDVSYDNVPNAGGNDDVILWDLNFHYYPWDNARWRPYASFGFGVARFDFDDEFGNRVRKATFGMPIGVGMKYLIYRNSAFRLDLTDNIAFSAGPMDTQHNVSLTAGLEIRFGGVRRSYWPWNPGQDYGYW